MIRWLIIALFIYLVFRLVTGPRRSSKRTHPLFRFYFGRVPKGQDRDKQPRRSGFDQIEEAEYEDITEYEKKKSSK